MISYYDIRAACNAMKALQNKPLRRRKLDIHFSIPKVVFCKSAYFALVAFPLFIRKYKRYLLKCLAKCVCQENPSEKDINQGTLVVFNLDSSVSNDELREIFRAYGEIKEVSLNVAY